MKDILTDTQDIVERIWGKKIYIHFPAYKTFWDKFIGVRTISPSKTLLPYKYNLTNLRNISDKVKFKNNLEELCMAHYSLFCNLAGAHFQLEEFNRVLAYKNKKLIHFQYCETFENCYQHMGNAINFFFLFWEKIFLLTNVYVLRNSNGDLNKNNVSNQIELLFRRKRKFKIVKQIIKHFGRKGEIEIIRNNTVHYARVAFIPAGEFGYALPYRFKPNQRWSQMKRRKTGILVQIKARNNLLLLEKILNSSELIAIDYLHSYLLNNNIEIQY